MAVKNLNNLVLKTVLVSVKLPAPADCIGSGFATDIDINPATFLSLGQFPLPRLPEREPQVRSGREEADMTMMSLPPSRMPASSVGSHSGTKVCHRHASPVFAVYGDSDTTRTNPRTRPTTNTATALFAAVWPVAGASRTSYPGLRAYQSRIGRDCQSPVRQQVDKRGRDAKPVIGWHRTANPAAAAAK
ncbi:hypothetical protein [Fimbriiglobus ruber]|uniref:Uncharacterized protein n=1 Tax=Fimbriiglobus ruber TaxID=1908690 RepID=A0A225DL60_9BACT|nr:hypothetical protein [Fimbriiglobus ruber]OWK37909.1 hypothetical protein FRUB_07029 [Fimbriiglobus ruber]